MGIQNDAVKFYEFNCAMLIIQCQQQWGMLKLIHWPFKSMGNLAITSIGLVGATFWGYSIYSESKFNQPIIGQSIKLLGKHSQIKELVGYPLAYSFSISNRFVEKEGQSYFAFQVNGPKSNTNVQMTAGTMPASKLYNYGEKNQKISSIQQRISAQQQRILNLQKEGAKATPKKQKQLNLQKATQVNKLKSIKDQLVQAKYDVIQKQNRYYVPEKHLYTKINDPRSKGSSQTLDKQQLLWGINDLVITLPNRTKMIVLPEAKKPIEQKQKIVQQFDMPDPPTMGALNKKIFIDVSEFSKEEIEQYGKQKTNFMYTKYGSYRLVSMVIFLGALTGIILYKQRSILKNVKGSILEEEVKRLLNKNQKIVNILQEKKKKELEFDHLIGGGISNNHFNCVMYIKNLTNGRIQFQGKYKEDMNVYQYQKMLLKYRQKQVKKQIDLLK